jgi:MurNAc alpha-1-phosphate uridylyltransferase
MRAMILAAGRGERLRPLTDDCPKPLLEAGGKPLIAWHLENLALAGFREVVINISHLGGAIRKTLGDGGKWGLNITYSREPRGALETGGGIFQALPLLGDAPFLVVNGDIWSGFPLGSLRAVKCDYAHLVLVPNPACKPAGDFALDRARVANTGRSMHTFSGICAYHPRMFENCKAGRYSVVPLLRETIDRHLVTGELYAGPWHDAGTPERLQALRTSLHGRD